MSTLGLPLRPRTSARPTKRNSSTSPCRAARTSWASTSTPAARKYKATTPAVSDDARNTHLGNFVKGKRSDFELNLTEATFAQLVKTSFTASLTLETPPGSYSVRAVMEDGLDRKLTAASET